MQTRIWITSLTAALAFAAIGCSDSTSPAGSTDNSFDSQVTADLAPSAAEDISSDVSFISGADLTGSGGAFSVIGANATIAGDGVSASINTMPAGAVAVWISSRCTFDAGTGRFSCPPLTRGNQIYTINYALFDASGVAQSAYDKVTTASINFVVTDSGATSYTFNGSTFSDTTLRRHNRTVSGLAGDPDTVHTWNGVGSGSVHSTRTGQISKVYVLSANDTTTGIKFRQPRDINPYPLSGTLVKNYDVTRTRQASDTTTHTATRRVVVTFNGTVNVPMTINGESYMLNLDTHKATKQ